MVIFLLILETLLLLPKLLAMPIHCPPLLAGLSGASTSPSMPMRDLHSIEEWTMMTFNVENVFELQGKFKPDENTQYATRVQTQPKAPREWRHRAELAKVILAHGRNRKNPGPDVLVLEEIESRTAAENFNRDFLGERYVVHHVDGNDGRGIDIVMMVKRDLPLEFEYRTHKDRLWEVPDGLINPHVENPRVRKLFSRDLPVLIIRTQESLAPLAIVVGTHFKSKRPGYKDPQSRIYRGVQAAEAANIIKGLHQEFGQEVPLFMAGDFNGVVGAEREFDPLFEDGLLEDAFDLRTPPMVGLDRVSQTYHPKGGDTVKQQLDAWLLNKAAQRYFRMAWVHRYRWRIGKLWDGTRPLPETWNDRRHNPSDHFPLLLLIDFRQLYWEYQLRNGLSQP